MQMHLFSCKLRAQTPQMLRTVVSRHRLGQQSQVGHSPCVIVLSAASILKQGGLLPFFTQVHLQASKPRITRSYAIATTLRGRVKARRLLDLVDLSQANTVPNTRLASCSDPRPSDTSRTKKPEVLVQETMPPGHLSFFQCLPGFRVISIEP